MKLASGILLQAKDTGRLLFVLRNDKQPTWSFLGGGVEDGETLLTCAKRELYEEAGFIADIHYTINSHDAIHITKRYAFEYHCFIGTTETEIVPKLNNEHLDYKWANLEDIEHKHFGIVDLLSDEHALDIIKKGS